MDNMTVKSPKITDSQIETLKSLKISRISDMEDSLELRSALAAFYNEKNASLSNYLYDIPERDRFKTENLPSVHEASMGWKEDRDGRVRLYLIFTPANEILAYFTLRSTHIFKRTISQSEMDEIDEILETCKDYISEKEMSWGNEEDLDNDIDRFIVSKINELKEKYMWDSHHF